MKKRKDRIILLSNAILAVKRKDLACVGAGADALEQAVTKREHAHHH